MLLLVPIPGTDRLFFLYWNDRHMVLSLILNVLVNYMLSASIVRNGTFDVVRKGDEYAQKTLGLASTVGSCFRNCVMKG